jgi:hypothetical protein
MKKQVRMIDKSDYLTASVKRAVLQVVNSNDPKFLNTRIKVGKLKLKIEKLDENKYRVTEYLKRISIIDGQDYETESKDIVEVL